MSRGWSPGCTGSKQPAEGADPRAGRGDDPGRPRRRLRPGDDGPRRDHLPARRRPTARPARCRRDCAARASGTPEAFPAPKAEAGAAAAPRHRLVDRARRRVWLVRRPAKGMLGGMAALPGGEWTDEPPSLPSPPLARVRHVFTHFALDLAVVRGGRARRRRLVAAARPARTRPACRRFTGAPASRCWPAPQRAPAPPEPAALEEARTPA